MTLGFLSGKSQDDAVWRPTITMNVFQLDLGKAGRLSTLGVHSLFEAPRLGLARSDGIRDGDGRPGFRLADALEEGAYRTRMPDKRPPRVFTDLVWMVPGMEVECDLIETGGECTAAKVVGLQHLIDKHYRDRSWFDRPSRVVVLPNPNLVHRQIFYFGSLLEVPAADSRDHGRLLIGRDGEMAEVSVLCATAGERVPVLLKRSILFGQGKVVVGSSLEQAPLAVTGLDWQSKVIVDLSRKRATDVQGVQAAYQSDGNRQRWTLDTGLAIEVIEAEAPADEVCAPVAPDPAEPAAAPSRLAGGLLSLLGRARAGGRARRDPSFDKDAASRVEPVLTLQASGGDEVGTKTVLPVGPLRKDPAVAPADEQNTIVMGMARRKAELQIASVYSLDLVGLALPRIDREQAGPDVRGFRVGLLPDGGLSGSGEGCAITLGASCRDGRLWYAEQGNKWREVPRREDGGIALVLPGGFRLLPAPLDAYHAFLMLPKPQRVEVRDAEARTFGRGRGSAPGRVAFAIQVPDAIDMKDCSRVALDRLVSRSHVIVSLLHGQVHLRPAVDATSPAWKVSADLTQAEELGGAVDELVIASGEHFLAGSVLVAVNV